LAKTESSLTVFGSLRPYLPPPLPAFAGVFISSIQPSHSANHTFVWIQVEFSFGKKGIVMEQMDPNRPVFNMPDTFLPL